MTSYRSFCPQRSKPRRCGETQKIVMTVTVIASLLISFVVIWLNTGTDPALALARELQVGDTDARYHALKDLEELGPDAVEAVDQLAEALTDSELKIRYRAAKTLAEIGPGARSATAALASALHDSDRDVRYYAAKALYKIGANAEESLPIVIEALNKGETDASVRRYMAKILGETGADSPEAKRVVNKLVRDSDAKVREVANEVLQQLGK